MEWDQTAAGVVDVLIVLLQSVVQPASLGLLCWPAVVVRLVHWLGPVGLLCWRDGQRGPVDLSVGHDLAHMMMVSGVFSNTIVWSRMFPEIERFTKNIATLGTDHMINDKSLNHSVTFLEVTKYQLQVDLKNIKF